MGSDVLSDLDALCGQLLSRVVVERSAWQARMLVVVQNLLSGKNPFLRRIPTRTKVVFADCAMPKYATMGKFLLLSRDTFLLIYKSSHFIYF
jgi:hypothetical protein